MDLSRRTFLIGSLALAGASVVPVDAWAGMPRIVGDGVHDDAPGFNALLAGEPVNVECDGVRFDGEIVWIMDGPQFFVAETIRVPFDRGIDGGTFLIGHDGYAVSSPGNLYLRNGVFVGNGYGGALDMNLSFGI